MTRSDKGRRLTLREKTVCCEGNGASIMLEKIGWDKFGPNLQGGDVHDSKEG